MQTQQVRADFHDHSSGFGAQFDSTALLPGWCQGETLSNVSVAVSPDQVPQADVFVDGQPVSWVSCTDMVASGDLPLNPFEFVV